MKKSIFFLAFSSAISIMKTSSGMEQEFTVMNPNNHLDQALLNQDYHYLKDFLYQKHSPQTYKQIINWIDINLEKGHVPMLYWKVKFFFDEINSTKELDLTLQKSRDQAFISLVASILLTACDSVCVMRIDPTQNIDNFYAYNSLTNKYIYWWNYKGLVFNYVSLKKICPDFSKIITSVTLWFYTFDTQTGSYNFKEDFPNPAWVRLFNYCGLTTISFNPMDKMTEITQKICNHQNSIAAIKKIRKKIFEMLMSFYQKIAKDDHLDNMKKWEILLSFDFAKIQLPETSKILSS